MQSLEVKNLTVQVGEKVILSDISMRFDLGKNYCLLGKNGSGKSSISSVIAGNPKYEVVSGEIIIQKEEDNINMLELGPDERSKQGIFLSFQNVPEIGGIRLSEYLRTIYNLHLKNEKPDAPDISPFIFKRHIKKHLEELMIDESFLDRELNVGFSGGEKRKIEILQMKLIGPKYIILDEIDSGLDLDAFRSVATLLREINNENNTIVIITHYFTILDYIEVDEVFVLEDGKLKEKGGMQVIERIKQDGYK